MQRQARSVNEKPAKPPVLSTKAMLFVALWRFRIELDGLDWEKLALSEADIAEAKAAWAAIVASVKEGIAKANAANAS
jgi:hypothetical protein